MINLESIEFSYDKFSSKVLANCSCEFASKSLNLILGDNGSGKSTLMDMITGFKRPQKGRVIINRAELYKPLCNVATLRKVISYMPSGLKLPPYLDVEYMLKLWMGSYHSHELIDALGLDDFMKHKYLHLSDGYKTRTHLAIALSRGGIVLLDEPLKSQDAELCKVFPRLLDLCSKGRTFIVSSPIVIDGVKWDSVLKLKGGKLI